MCGLFGFVYYGKKSLSCGEKLAQKLGERASVRGTDSTGIAYNDSDTKKPDKSVLKISKMALPASKITMSVPTDVRVVMGHTRAATQGDPKQNYNNHPFPVNVGKDKAAFAHNGVIWNEYVLAMGCKTTKVKTDSYAVVQHIEKNNETFGVEALKKVAEQVEGSFTFTFLDTDDNLYIVKNDNPMSIIHFPEYALYVYASTFDILMKALLDVSSTSDLVEEAIKKETIMDLLQPKEGEIWVINNKGEISKSTFTPLDTWGSRYGGGSWGNTYRRSSKKYTAPVGKFTTDTCAGTKMTSRDSVYNMSSAYGLYHSDVDNLYLAGYSTMEIEDAMFCGKVHEILMESQELLKGETEISMPYLYERAAEYGVSADVMEELVGYGYTKEDLLGCLEDGSIYDMEEELYELRKGVTADGEVEEEVVDEEVKPEIVIVNNNIKTHSEKLWYKSLECGVSSDSLHMLLGYYSEQSIICFMEDGRIHELIKLLTSKGGVAYEKVVVGK